jgi:hypothetical protein
VIHQSANTDANGNQVKDRVSDSERDDRIPPLGHVLQAVFGNSKGADSHCMANIYGLSGHEFEVGH